MNLPAYFTGALRAIGRGDDWDSYFDLSRTGFNRSFIAVFLTLPLYYAIAVAVQERRSVVFGADQAVEVPILPFLIVFTVYALTFAVTAYILTMVFDRQDRFRPWVVVRHWALFFCVAFAAAGYGLFLLGVLPFNIAVGAAFVTYLATLAIDIRLAQKIVGFEWGAAVLTGCIITAMGFTILLTGITQFAG